MGGVASAVEDVVGGAVEAVGDAVEDVGQFVVDDIVEPVAQAVENTVQSIEKDPIGSIAKIAAVATGQFELLPLISAADTLAHGGSLEQAALNAGISYVAGEVGGEFADYADSAYAGGAAAGATGAAIRGGDITQGALSGVINTGINQGVDAAGDAYDNYCSSCGGQDTASCGSDTGDIIASSGAGPQGCESTQELGGLPTTVASNDDIETGQDDTCASENCMGEIEITACRPDSEDCQPVDITGGCESDYCTDSCDSDCEGEYCTEDCGECCSEDGGANFKNPFKLKFKKPKVPRIRTPKQPKVKIAGGLGGKGGRGGACTPNAVGGLGSVDIGNLGEEGCRIIPWLDTKADVLKGNMHLDKKGNLVIDNQKPEDLYGRMDKDLAAEFQDRFGGVPQVDITAGGALGGNYAKASGYASGGCVGCYCMNQNPKYFPRFVADGADMLQTTGSTKRQPIQHKPLKQLAQQISSHGNMGGLASGGLPKKYHEAMPKGHNPEFVTGLTGYYACGGGTGQSDDIKAMLHDGDYVMDADVVAALGDGSSKAGKDVLHGFLKQVPHKDNAGGKPVPANIADGEFVFPSGFVTALGGGDNKAGAKILDGLREKLRAHKRSAPTSKIPPKAKSPLDYIKQTKG